MGRHGVANCEIDKCWMGSFATGVALQSASLVSRAAPAQKGRNLQAIYARCAARRVLLRLRCRSKLRLRCFARSRIAAPSHAPPTPPTRRLRPPPRLPLPATTPTPLLLALRALQTSTLALPRCVMSSPRPWSNRPPCCCRLPPAAPFHPLSPPPLTTTPLTTPSPTPLQHPQLYQGDYTPRAGRKGRFIKDDPTKYPSKEDLGVFSGATGE